MKEGLKPIPGNPKSDGGAGEGKSSKTRTVTARHASQASWARLRAPTANAKPIISDPRAIYPVIHPVWLTITKHVVKESLRSPPLKSLSFAPYFVTFMDATGRGRGSNTSIQAPRREQRAWRGVITKFAQKRRYFSRILPSPCKGKRSLWRSQIHKIFF